MCITSTKKCIFISPYKPPQVVSINDIYCEPVVCIDAINAHVNDVQFNVSQMAANVNVF